MRHDCFWFSTLELSSLPLPAGVIYTATWCESSLLPWCERLRRSRSAQARRRNTTTTRATTTMTTTTESSAPTGETRPSKKEKEKCGDYLVTRYRGVHDYFLIAQSATLAQFVASLLARRALHNNDNRLANDRAHFVFEEHAAAMGLVDKGLWRAHPTALSYFTFALYRQRSYRLAWEEGAAAVETSWEEGEEQECRPRAGRVCLVGS